MIAARILVMAILSIDGSDGFTGDGQVFAARVARLHWRRNPGPLTCSKSFHRVSLALNARYMSSTWPASSAVGRPAMRSGI
jgi:hypothetical protein